MGALHLTRRTVAGADSREHEFRVFVLACSPELLQAAYLLLGDVDLAQDAVQGALLRVFRNWQTARDSPLPYSKTALVSVCRDRWRRQARRPRESPAPNADMPDSRPPFTARLEQRDELEQTIRKLPLEQQRVVVLRFFLGFTVSQTAAQLGIPDGTVKSASSRALEHLRGLLDSSKNETTPC